MNKNITNYQSALDINEIWAAIEPQVDEINAQRKKKRRPFFLYWLTGGILLIGLVGASFFLFPEAQTQTSKTLDGTSPNNIIQTTAAVVAIEDKADDNKTMEAITPIELEEPKAIPTTETPIQKTKHISPPQNSETIEKKSEVVEKKPKVVLPTASNFSNTTPPTITQSISVPKGTVQQPKKAIDNASRIAATTAAMTPLSKLPGTKVGLKMPEMEIPKPDFLIEESFIEKNNGVKPPPIYIEKPTFSIEFQTGISAVNRTLSATEFNNSSLDTLLTLRNTFEDPLEALHANLLVNAHFPSGFYVSSGVAFTQISEIYSNNSTQSVTMIDSMGIEKRVINIAGDTIDIIGPVATTTTTTFSKRFYNTYRMLDIPVFVGYQYDFGDWKTDFSVGVLVNLLLATDGRIPNTPTTDIELGTDQEEIYRSRVDYSLQFGIGVSKSLTEKLSIRVNPSFRYYSRNFIKEGVGLNQNYLLFGGTVGIRMDL